MMMTPLNYDRIVAKLQDWVSSLERSGHADKPLYRMSGVARPVSPRDILKAVKDKEPFGEKFVMSWIDMAMDHILDAPVASAEAP